MSLKLQILMALLSCAAVKAKCTSDGLEDGEVKCTSCFGYTACAEGVATHPVCDPGTICLQQGATIAECVLPGSYECATCPAGSFTVCDPFNPNLVDVCVAGQAPSLFEDCSLNNKICQNGVCVAATTTTPNPGDDLDIQCSEATNATDPNDQAFIAYKPECTSGLLCHGGAYVSSVNCTEGQYFDPVMRQCQNLPVNNCEGQDDGVAPYRTDCTKYVRCYGGEEVAEFDCDPGFVFDVVTNDCVNQNVDPYQCSDLAGCTLESDGPC